MTNVKQKVLIGVEGKLSKAELDFFSTRFEVEEVPFTSLMKTRPKKKLDFLYFSGGADVNPGLYGQNVGKFTHIDAVRDELCSAIFQNYNQVPKLGICRGAQLLTVLSGGKLIQHVEGHTHNHTIDVHFEENNRPTTLNITSTHHQMMFPFNMNSANYSLIGWSTMYKSMIYLDGNDKQMELPEKFVEPEIVYYKNQRSLAIQGHPEFENCDKSTKELCLDLVETYLL